MRGFRFTSPPREPSEEVPTDAPGSEWDALIRNKRGPTQRTIKVKVVEPAIEAILMEHVTTIQLSNLVPISETAKAHHALGSGHPTHFRPRPSCLIFTFFLFFLLLYGAVLVGKGTVEVELIG